MTASTEHSASHHASIGRVPDFFIVGHPKCGTTALYAMLQDHPDIYMPAVKEPRFFRSDVRAPGGIGRTGTLEGYLSLFEPARADQRAGEATPLYLMSHTAASAIAEMQPAARIVGIFREPADFLRSLHLQFLQANLETETDLATAISLEDERRRGRNLPKRLRRADRLMYSDYVRYVEQLRRYHAVFPSEQVLALVYDDFRNDNAATVRKVLRFLDVDDTAPIELVEANPTVQVRSVFLNDLIRGLSVGRGSVGRALNAGVKKLMPRSARHQALRVVNRRFVHGDPAAPDEGFMRELRRRFKGEVVAFSEYLDRDLVSLWGYDRLD